MDIIDFLDKAITLPIESEKCFENFSKILKLTWRKNEI